MLIDPWRIILFGQLQAQQGARQVTHFRTRKVSALLAFLAYHPERAHPREVLIEQFWPDREPEAGRHNLRQTLLWLRHVLEPPGIAAHSILISDHTNVRLNSAAFTTDVVEFERAIQTFRRTTDPEQQRHTLQHTVALYTGELLPGMYEDWVLTERARLAESYQEALRHLTGLHEQQGDLDSALECARRAVQTDLLDETAHCVVMRLHLALGQPDAARNQYQQLERILREELDCAPSPEARALEQQAFVSTPVARSSAQRAPRGDSARSSVVLTEKVSPPSVSPRLPVPLTHYFGREAESARVRELLRDPQVRLVTLTGPGGSGKTRLALEIARSLTDLFETAVYFVALADHTQADFIPRAIADALGLPRNTHTEPLTQCLECLADRRALLVLDNFEHLLEHPEVQLPASLAGVQTLLERAPGLTCLVTSRQRLNITGEWEIVVPPLPVPTEGITPEEAIACASVQLFVDRARAARTDFALTARNVPSVIALCAQLEGIPLAIELAAAWAATLTPQQMLTQMQSRFNFLVSRNRDAATRHRTLRAAISWSFHVLPPELQRFCARLSVFHGGWTLAAAEAVCDPVPILGELGSGATLDFLTQLRERSLLVAEEEEFTEGQIRFRMLETVREFAAEQLEATEREAAAHRHADYFMKLAEKAEGPFAIEPARLPVWLDRMEVEHENLRTALTWCLNGGDIETGMRTVFALAWFWSVRGYGQEWRAWIQRAYECREQASEALQARALFHASGLGDAAVQRARLEECLALYRKLKDASGTATVYDCLASIARASGDFSTAQTLCEQGLALREQVGDIQAVGWSLATLTTIHQHQGDFVQACALMERGRQIGQQLGDEGTCAKIGIAWAHIAGHQGKFAEARAMLEHSLAVFQARREKWNIADSLRNLGIVTTYQGHFEIARDCLQQSLAQFETLPDWRMKRSLLTDLAWLAWHQGELEEALRFSEAALAVLPPTGSEGGGALWLAGYLRWRQDQTAGCDLLQASLEQLRNNGGIHPFLAWATQTLGMVRARQGDTVAGRALLRESLELCARMGLLPCGVRALTEYAALLTHQGEPQRAVILLAAAEALRATSGLVLPPLERQDMEQYVADARALLEAPDFDAAWSAGTAMPLQQALQFALL